MSSTRLMLLGVVRIFQPAYGYQLRRELLSWNVETWADINPGSIYSGLRTLARHGLLAETKSADEGGTAGEEPDWEAPDDLLTHWKAEAPPR